ncbi:MAG: AAA family ATPase [Desulfobacterales bacterium]|nr:MAG: AAA family ATPase [Desulfobacterales bacterium]
MHLRKVVFYPEKYPTTEDYPFNLTLFRQTPSIPLNSPVTFFVGENGSGKSTLLEALTRRCGIMIWRGIERPRFKASPYAQELYRFIEVEWNAARIPGSFFGSQIFRNFAQLLDEWATMDPGLIDYFGGKSLVAQSHGQSLMAFFKSRFKIKGIYFLDEPETALSPHSQLELLHLLQAMSRAGHAQFIIATHSPLLLACRDAQILNFDEVPLQSIDYEQTAHYRIYKEFMADPQKYLLSN